MGLHRKFAIAVGMSVDEDGVRTHLGGGAQRHGGMHSEFASGIGRGRDDSAFVALASDYNGPAFERGIVQFFHGNEEGVHVDVEDGAGEGGLARGSHSLRILAAGLLQWSGQHDRAVLKRVAAARIRRHVRTRYQDRHLASHSFVCGLISLFTGVPFRDAAGRGAAGSERVGHICGCSGARWAFSA